MAVTVAALECKDITFILCVSTSQDTISCKISIFIHWIYCFQQKIPLPDATTSWRREKSQQAKCQGMYSSSLCISPVAWCTDSFSKGNCGRLTPLTNSESWSGISSHPEEFCSCGASGSDESLDSCVYRQFSGCSKSCPEAQISLFSYFKLKMYPRQLLDCRVQAALEQVMFGSLFLPLFPAALIQVGITVFQLYGNVKSSSYGACGGLAGLEGLHCCVTWVP